MATAVLTPHRDAVRGPPPLARARPVPGRALLAIPEAARAGSLARALEEVGLLPPSPSRRCGCSHPWTPRPST